MTGVAAGVLLLLTSVGLCVAALWHLIHARSFSRAFALMVPVMVLAVILGTAGTAFTIA